MWWLAIVGLVVVGALAALVWGGLQASKLRFRDQAGDEVSPDDVPGPVIASLTSAVEPLLEVGFQVESLRKIERGPAHSWQAILSSAGGMVWSVVEHPEDLPESARSVTLFSRREDSQSVVTRDGGSVFPRFLQKSTAHREQYASALAQSEAHAAKVLSGEIPLKSLAKQEFESLLEQSRSRRIDELFEQGWFREDGQGDDLRIAPRKLLKAGFEVLRSFAAKKPQSVAWWEESVVQEVPTDSESPQEAAQPAERESLSEAPDVAEEALGEETLVVSSDIPEFPENLDAPEMVDSSEALPEIVVEETSNEDEAAIAPELAQECSWERDVTLYRASASKKSWAYWLRARGAGLFVIVGFSLLVLWLIANDQFSASFGLYLLGAFLIHELGHAVVMLVRRKWDSSLFLLPIPQPMAAKRWRIEGGAGEMVSLLAGPLPGLIAGWSIMGYGFAGGVVSATVLDFALSLMIVNTVLLLPLRPLDGGRLWDILLFRALPAFRVPVLAIGGLVLIGGYFFGGGLLSILGGLLLIASIPSAIYRAKVLPWLKVNLEQETDPDPEVALAVIRERRSRSLIKGPGGFAKLDELIGLTLAKKAGRSAVLLGVLTVLVAMILPIVMPGVALGRRAHSWFQVKQEAEVIVQDYLGARPAASQGEDIEYDLRVLKEGFQASPGEPEKVLADPNILAALRETKWRGVAHWIDEDPVSRHPVIENSVKALHRDAARSADKGLPDRAFSNLSVAIRILVECEPRHSLDAWVAWSELERDVLKELEDISSRYPLQDKFSQWYENALAKTPQQTSPKLAGLMLQEEANATLSLQGSLDELLKSHQGDSQRSPGSRFLALIRRFGDLVPVESLQQQVSLSSAISRAPSPFSAPEIMERKGFEADELRQSLARLGINRSYREIAIAALLIKRLGTEQAQQQLASLQEKSGFTATVRNEGSRESLLLSRLNENGDEVQLEWLLRR